MANEPAAPPVSVHDLPPDRVTEAIGVLSRGMRDNPLHVAAFGDDPERRRRGLQRIFAAFFRVMTAQAPLCAVAGERIVGVTGVAPPGTCQPTSTQRLRMAPAVLALGPVKTGRVVRWVDTWAKRDPAEPHAHLGPLAVDAHLQGRGIGSRILAEHCGRLDAQATLGYLETDKPENVRLYERFGFLVVAEAPVLGVPNWFMRREAGHR